ncbi:hypothetical protein Plhal304r1_c051g0134791 [Plasmopara halstedii]
MKVSGIFNHNIMVLALFASAVTYKAVDSSLYTKSHYWHKKLSCWAISVEHDATYCIDGPICSGYGLYSTGSLCPVKGDVAIADCHPSLVSYKKDKSCVLSENATCQVIHTGAWGCVIDHDSNRTHGQKKYDYNSSNEHMYGAKNKTYKGSWYHGNGSAASNGTIWMASGTEAVSAGGTSAGVIAVIAAAAAVIAAIAGAAIYRKHAAQVREEEAEKTMVEVVTP